MPETVDIAIFLGRFGTGGVERVACHVANGLAARGYRTEMVVADADGPARDLLRADVGVTALGSGRGTRRDSIVAALPALMAYLRRRRPKVLLSPGNHTHVIAAMAHAAAARGGTHLVVKITNPLMRPWYRARKRMTKRLVYRAVLGRASRILVLSGGGVGAVAELAGERIAERVVFVPNPYVSPTDDDGGETENRSGVLAVGRLTKQKDFGLLLEAVARIPELRLTILGEGPERDALAEAAARLGIEKRVTFEGFVVDPKRFFRNAACLVISSRWEDLPAVALEALSRRCPVVATDCSPALSDIVHASGQGAVVARTADALAAGIRATLAAPPMDKAPALVDLYTIEGAVEAHVAALMPFLQSGDAAR